VQIGIFPMQTSLRNEYISFAAANTTITHHPPTETIPS
jgi:hypothetical protein